jgi:acetyl-CoA synthetase
VSELDGSRLEAYRFHEREWENYGDLCNAFEWVVPEKFNMATYVCDRWADADRENGNEHGTDERDATDRIALFAETEAGERGTYTFGELRAAANGLADYLVSQGVSRGDRVGVNVPQKPETVISHLAAWKLGAVSVPLSTLFGPDALSYRLADSEAVACVVDDSNVDTLRGVRGTLPALDAVVTVDAAARRGKTGFEAAIGAGNGEGDNGGDSDTDGGSNDGDGDGGDTPERAVETVTTDAAEDAILIYTSGRPAIRKASATLTVCSSATCRSFSRPSVIWRSKRATSTGRRPSGPGSPRCSTWSFRVCSTGSRCSRTRVANSTPRRRSV